MKLTIKILLILLTASIAGAADPQDPSSANYIAAKADQKKWNASASASIGQGFNEFQEAFASYGATLGYKLGDNLTGDVNLSYTHTLDFEAANPDRWEWEDVRFRLVWPSVWSDSARGMKLRLNAAYYAPLSKTSQNATTFGQMIISAPATLSRGRFLFGATPALVLSYHEYDTRDTFGFVKNSPLGVSGSAFVKMTLTKSLSAVGSASIYSYADYEGEVRNVQTISGSLDYVLSKKLSASVNARWRDRIITNNSLFDDDASRMSLSLSYLF